MCLDCGKRLLEELGLPITDATMKIVEPFVARAPLSEEARKARELPVMNEHEIRITVSYQPGGDCGVFTRGDGLDSVVMRGMVGFLEDWAKAQIAGEMMATSIRDRFVGHSIEDIVAESESEKGGPVQ